MHWANEGAFTGEVSAGMLSRYGCQWVIVAHSERREYFGETEETALKKICAALDAGLDAHLLRRRTAARARKRTERTRCSAANCRAAWDN